MTACRQDTPRFRIGVAQCSDDSWRHKMNDEILREAMFYNGVSVEIRSAGDDNSKQAEDVHYFMDEGVDLLIISANEAAPMTQFYYISLPFQTGGNIVSYRTTNFIIIGSDIGSITDRIERFDSCNGTASGIYGCHQ